MTTIKHYYQPTGNTCGPTCIYMVHNFLSLNEKTTIKDIETLCETDWVVGTPPDRMEKGMKALKMDYVEYLGSPRPYELLRGVIDSKNIPIVRTITKGVPHWIVISGYQTYKDDDTIIYQVLDPWQGKINYTEEQLDEVWSQRQYQFFEVIYNTSKVDPLTGNIDLRYDPTDFNGDYYL